VRRRLIDAERTALLGARRNGLIPESTAEAVLARLDERTLELDHALHGAADGSVPEGGRKSS
jgi:monovalent cation:H+ antiporter, CPA1 family